MLVGDYVADIDFLLHLCAYLLYFFLVLGAGLIAGGKLSANYLDELCSSNQSDNTFQKSLSQLYTKADTIVNNLNGNKYLINKIAKNDELCIDHDIFRKN